VSRVFRLIFSIGTIGKNNQDFFKKPAQAQKTRYNLSIPTNKQGLQNG
jgi:hypothetical protein